MTPGLVLMNSLKWGYRLFMAILDPHKITIKMPRTGIDVTLTSCFTGPAFSSATFSSARPQFAPQVPRVRESPSNNQAQPDVRNIQ
jgi:hypothetical protein